MNFHSYLIKSPIPMATILWPLPPLSTCKNSLFSVHWTLSRSSNTESYKLYTSCKYGKHTTHNIINSMKFTISHPWITFVHMTVCLFSYFCLFVKFSSVQWLQIKCSKDLKKSEGQTKSGLTLPWKVEKFLIWFRPHFLWIRCFP